MAQLNMKSNPTEYGNRQKKSCLTFFNLLILLWREINTNSILLSSHYTHTIILMLHNQFIFSSIHVCACVRISAGSIFDISKYRDTCESAIPIFSGIAILRYFWY